MAAITWFLVVTGIMPETGGRLALWYFFSSLYLTLSGCIYLGAYLFQVKILGRQPPLSSVRACTRQGMLLGALVALALMLQGWRLLTWFNALILIVLLTFVELLVVTRERHPAGRAQ